MENILIFLIEHWSYIIVLIMGLGHGSFATMATYRLPRNKPWVGDKPRCFTCNAELSILDYFSVISYFVHKGKCRHCGVEYEARLSYFFTELGITGFLLYAHYLWGFSDMFVIANALIINGIILAVIDAENKFIPAKVLISFLLFACIYRTFIDQTFYNIIFAGAAGAIIGLALRSLALRNKNAMDLFKWQHEDRFNGPYMDYVKLLAIIAIWLPFKEFFEYLIITVPVIFLWGLIHKKSLRIGTVMTIFLFIIFLAS